MTKAYQRMSVGDALYTAARKYPGSVEALAARLGKTPNVLRSKLSPDVETHHVTLEEALQIIELLDCTVPHAADLAAKAIGWRLNRVMIRHNGVDSDPTSLEVQCLAACSYMGLLSAEVAVVTARKSEQQLTRKEADTLSDAIAHCLDALFLLRDSVEQRTVS